jgi:flavin reductase (DIM6/NTAB) family NADH-FMN oxidoreductase RutF
MFKKHTIERKTHMNTKHETISRRRFIQNSASAALLAGIGTYGCSAADTPNTLILPRKELAEPGPMIPPVPAILLTVKGKEDRPDDITVIWTFVLNGDPPQIGISVGDEHTALELIKLHGEFVLNLPVEAIVKQFDTVDMNTGKSMDKYELSGLTRGKALKIDAPTVEESPIQLECRVTDSLRVPPSRTLFTADVVATTFHEGVCDNNGRLNVSKTQFFGMTSGSGEFYTMGKRVGNIGMTVGRTDIRY